MSEDRENPREHSRRETVCEWNLSTDGLSEYITPHGNRVPSSHVQGFHKYTNCPYCGGTIRIGGKEEET